MRYYPQLAKADVSGQVIGNPSYALEEKLDGIRCLVYVENNRISLYSRTGKPLDTAFPDVLESLKGILGENGLILDGEIIPITSGHTFQNLQTRLQRISNIEAAIVSCPVRFVAFDLIMTPTVEMLNKSLEIRHSVLEQMCEAFNIPCSQFITQEQAEAILLDESREGIIAKHRLKEYYPGQRHGSWLKVKAMRQIDAIVGGCTFGTGRRSLEAGSLLLGEETVDGLKYIGNVGTGYTDNMLAEICKLVEVFKIDESPFLDWPATHNDSLFVKTYCAPRKLIATVNFQERTREGMLRFPSFKAIKVDSNA